MQPSAAEHAHWRTDAASTVACLVLLLTGWLLGHDTTAGLMALWAAYLAGGWAPLIRSTRALAEGDFDVDLLMLLAAAGAGVVGHWLEGAVLLFLFSTGNTLEAYAFGRTRRSIEALMTLRPEDASVVTDGVERQVPIADLVPGMVVRIRPGDRVPVDGRVLAGSSSVDESTLTGEPIPARKGEGNSVFAGTLNGSGSLDVEVDRSADDTALARVIRLVEEAREAKAPTQGWIERIEGRYAVGVITAAALAALLPWLALGWTFDDAFYRAMTLLVVASPCALVISIPATIVSAVSNGARSGVLFKGGAHLDALATVRVAALDKTGTLTEGHPEVVDVFVGAEAALASTARHIGGDVAVANPEAGETAFARRELLYLAASVEVLSEHPLGDAIRRALAAEGEEPYPVDDFRSEPGSGVTGTVGGREVRVGRPTWVSGSADTPPRAVERWAEAVVQRAATPVYVAVDGVVVGGIAIADRPRQGIREAIEDLKAAGIERVVMLTGDDARTARAVADELGIDEVHAELMPEDKSTVLDELRRRYGPVAMVGDGVNDAPALAVADVGVAVGAVGTDVALETADIVLMGDDLGALAHAVRLSRRARRIVKQNLVFAVVVMAGLVALALGGWIGLTVGVVGHEGSTVVVVFNGLRLLRRG